MRAYARKNKLAGRPIRRSRHQQGKPLNPSISIHFEAGWTDSWSHPHCLHEHRTLREAAKCAMPHGAGWYVFAVENGEPRQLRNAEDEIVNHYRFSESSAKP